MKVYSYYATDAEGKYFSMYLEPIEVADEAEAETIGNAAVTSARTQDCVTAAYWTIDPNFRPPPEEITKF